ncbi:MAG: hypothetical protein JSW66_11115 [Phycisphaerales bacterium]|nr:MAG: hypothetical protein JSW66_11115 [Phycisphaerales bacterium]
MSGRAASQQGLATTCEDLTYKGKRTILVGMVLATHPRTPPQEIGNARSHRNVVENLNRTRGLPRIHFCGRAVYLTDAAKAWLENHLRRQNGDTMSPSLGGVFGS